MWVVLLRLYVEDTTLLRRHKAKYCASNISISYLLMSLLSLEGKLKKKKSNHSSDRQMSNYEITHAVNVWLQGDENIRIQGRRSRRRNEVFSYVKNKKQRYFSFLSLCLSTAQERWRISNDAFNLVGPGSKVGHVGWRLMQISVVFMRLEKYCFRRILYLGVPINLCYWNFSGRSSICLLL